MMDDNIDIFSTRVDLNDVRRLQGLFLSSHSLSSDRNATRTPAKYVYFVL